MTRSLMACCLLLCACGSEDAPVFRAGASVADITPTAWPLPMVGTFSYRPATSAHDPLAARALVLDDGATQIAIAVVDSCYVPRFVLDDAKARAEEATGIPASRMLISATHTHTAPPPAPGVGLRGPEAEAHVENEEIYTERLREGIATAIADAFARRAPAEIGFGSAELAEEVFNRRWFMKEGTIPPDPFGGTSDQVRMNPPRASEDLVKPAGPTDPEIAFLSVRSVLGEPIALLANYSLHYVGGIPPGQFSADYFGEFARAMTERLKAPEGFVAILSNGTSANINNIDFSKPRPQREPYEQVRNVASKVAAKVAEALPSVDYGRSAPLAMTERELTVGLRKPDEALYRRSQDLVTSTERAEWERPHIYAQWAIDLYDGPDTTEIKLQAVRVGDVGIAALPFETFVETGLELKARSAVRPMFTIELANGAERYLPTPEHHELGGYETWLGTNWVEEQASVKITDALLEMLAEVAKD